MPFPPRMHSTEGSLTAAQDADGMIEHPIHMDLLFTSFAERHGRPRCGASRGSASNPSGLPRPHSSSSSSNGVLWGQLFPSLIAPFLCPCDVAQVALVSRALHRATGRPETWKNMSIAFFGLTDDAALALEQVFDALHREESTATAPDAAEEGSFTSVSSRGTNVQALSVRRRESFSRRTSVDQNVWVLDDAANSPSVTPFAAAHESDNGVEEESRRWDMEASSVLMDTEESEAEASSEVDNRDMVRLKRVESSQRRISWRYFPWSDDEMGHSGAHLDSMDATDEECEDDENAEDEGREGNDHIISYKHDKDNFSSHHPHSRSSSSSSSSISSGSGSSNHSSGSNNSKAVSRSLFPVLSTPTASRHSVHVWPRRYESHNVESLPERTPRRTCAEWSPMPPLSRHHFLNTNTTDSLLLEAVHTWTAVGVEPLTQSRRALQCEELLVCAATMTRTAQRRSRPFPWRAYFSSIYERRVGAFVRSLATQRRAARLGMEEGHFDTAMQHWSRVIDSICQGGGGCPGAGAVLGGALCRTLRERAALHTRMGSHEAAHADLSLAALLDGSGPLPEGVAPDAAAMCYPEGSPTPAPNGRSSDEDHSPSLEEAYEAVARQDAPRRALFLRRWTASHGPSVLSCLSQYMLCDELHQTAPHVLQRAASCAREAYERLLVQAWRAYDRNQTETAVSDAELCLSLLPPAARAATEAFVPPLLVLLAHPTASTAAALLRLPPAPRAEGAATAFWSLAHFAARSGLAPTAAHALTRVAVLSRGANRRAAALALLAHARLDGGDRRAPPALARAALALDGGHRAAHRLLARLDGRRWRDPADDLRAATARHPRLSYPYQIRAAARMDEGNSRAAEEELGRVIALTGSPSDVALRLRFRLDAGEHEGALEDLALLVLLAPGQENYREWLMRRAEGEENGARLHALQQAMGIPPREVEEAQ